MDRSFPGFPKSSVHIAAWLIAVASSGLPVAAQPPSVDLQLQRVLSGLSSPVGLEHAGDGSGRLFILQQGGAIRVWDGSQVLPAPFLELAVGSGSERGLLGLAFHPDFASNRFFFVHYSDPATGDTVISRFRASAANPDVADPASEVVLLTQSQPFANHNGGKIAFGPDGLFYLGLGDGGSAGDPQNNAQNLNNLLGTILRLQAPADPADPTPAFGIPPSNPFVGVAGRDEIWVYGLRNPWRFSFDRATGDLFIGDVGQDAIEEISFQPAASGGGENYGWRLMEGTSCFNPPSGCNDGTLTLPILEYTHAVGCSVTGGFRYRGVAFPALDGIYFFGDFCSGIIWGATPDAGGNWQMAELLDTTLGIASFGEDEAGELYVVDVNGGTVDRLTTSTPPPPPPPPPVESCLFTETFGAGPGSFVFVDDPQDPAYTAGSASGGNVSVAVGGVDDADINGMLGSWEVVCSLGTSTDVTITVDASLTQAANYEAGEMSELRLTVNGSTSVLASFNGDGNGGAAQTTGVQTFVVNATLPTGVSTVSLGCFNNQKTLADEQTDCVFDRVVVADGPPAPPPPPGNECLHIATFETGAEGWVQGADTCTTGSFVVGTPTEVVNGGVLTQPAGASTGALALFTAPNTAAGTDDVDGGTCEALSPAVDVSDAPAASVLASYFHGQRDAGDDPADGFVIEVLNNGVVVETLAAIGDVTSDASWTGRSVLIFDPGIVRLRVRVTDGPADGDLVEAGIDDVAICKVADPPPPPGCAVEEEFESGAAGWVNDASSTCTTGEWVVGTPTEVANGGVTTQVGGANSGLNALFTATNTAAGTNDVDGGNCILSSPTFSVAAASTLSVAYFHGQRDAGDDPGGDFFALEVSTDGGVTFSAIASNGDATSNAAWTVASAPIAAGSDVVLRVQCSDGAGPGDLVECGLDDVSICAD